MMSSKSVFNLPFPEFFSKMCLNKITIFPVFLNITHRDAKNLENTGFFYKIGRKSAIN
jgi:hypothetical protein